VLVFQLRAALSCPCQQQALCFSLGELLAIAS